MRAVCRQCAGGVRAVCGQRAGCVRAVCGLCAGAGGTGRELDLTGSAFRKNYKQIILPEIVQMTSAYIH